MGQGRVRMCENDHRSATADVSGVSVVRVSLGVSLTRGQRGHVKVS